MITNIYLFFTFWVFILTIFSEFTIKYFNLTFLSTIVLIIGSIFSYIYPGYYVLILNDKEYKIDGITKILSDIIFHLLVFVYNYNKFGFSDSNIENSIILLIFYVLVVDVNKLYRLNLEKVI